MKYLTLFFKTGGLALLFLLISGCSKGETQQPSPAVSPQPLQVHPDYTLTPSQLKEMTGDLPESMAQGINQNPQDFLEDLSALWSYPADYFVVADKEHFLPSDYYPQDLKRLTQYDQLTLSRSDLSLREIILPDLFAMVEAARQEGLTLVISSTFRSFQYQDGLFKRNVERYGLETASRESARPGTSQHQLGTTVDFGSITDEYAFTPPGKWLLENAWQFGFSLSYPDGYEPVTGYRYENWHYRWITREGTRIQREWFGDIQHYFLAFLNDNREALKTSYLKDL